MADTNSAAPPDAEGPAAALVQQDLTLALGPYFERIDVRFAPDVHPGGQPDDTPIIGGRSGRMQTVAWLLDASIHRASMAGFGPTRRSVHNIQGVTIIDWAAEPPLLRRFFNELEFFRQLGIRLGTRTFADADRPQPA